ncbi:MAG TPA: enoyl-CoA hydratase-related protein [Planctomycetaceae bacterium]|nr:enoyl-CoA hydratase-related protein [Planctomycetaceae bacterium]
MTTPLVLLETPTEATAIVTLNRPDRRNALSIELMESLCRTLRKLAAEPSRRAVILCGAGPAFCAGLDLIEAADGRQAERSAELIADCLRTLMDSPLVTIAAVHGAAYAGGVGLLAGCDFVVASDDVTVCCPEVRRGLVPALISIVLRQRLCESDLRELLLVAEPMDAAKVLEIGLVNRVVPREELLPEARSLAESILRGAPEAVRQTKRLLRRFDDAELTRQFQQALEAHKQARQHDEAREGLAAFQEHRPPRWQ